MNETQVFRLSAFEPNKCYAFALITRQEGSWPNERFFTTHPLKYLGKHMMRKSQGSGDGAKITEIFEGGNIEYNYEGTTSFVEVPCKQGGGKRKSKKSRRNAKSRKTQRRTRVR